MGLDLLGIDGLALGVDARGDHIGALVHVGEEQGGADAGLRMQTGAPVAVPAGADLEVEGAVHPVLLCPENGCQVLRHFSLSLDFFLLCRERSLFVKGRGIVRSRVCR